MRIRVFSLLLFLALSCQGERFSPFETVNKFRILAIQSSNPEMRPTEKAKFSALMHIPKGKKVDYQWEWCPFRTRADNKFECPMTKDELIQLLSENIPNNGMGNQPPIGAIPLEDFDLGTEVEPTLAYPAPPELLRGICEGLQEQAKNAPAELANLIPTYNCDDGYNISIRLSAKIDGKEFIAVKRMKLWLGSMQNQDQNPSLTTLSIRPKTQEDKNTLLAAGHEWVNEINDFEKDWHILSKDTPTQILVGIGYELRSSLDPLSIQKYKKRAPEGAEKEFLETRSEVLEFQWLTSFGSLNPSTKLHVEGEVELEDSEITAIFFPQKDFSQDFNGADGEAFVEACDALRTPDLNDGCEIIIWSVVRDDRLGVGWNFAKLIATGVK